MRGAKHSVWREYARRVIADTHADLPADAPLKERKAKLRLRAYAAHGGTSWGRKVWGQECRLYLEQHGQKPRQRSNQPKLTLYPIFPCSRGRGA